MIETEADYQDLIRRLRGEYRLPITDGLGPAGGEGPNTLIAKDFGVSGVTIRNIKKRRVWAHVKDRS